MGKSLTVGQKSTFDGHRDSVIYSASVPPFLSLLQSEKRLNLSEICAIFVCDNQEMRMGDIYPEFTVAN